MRILLLAIISAVVASAFATRGAASADLDQVVAAAAAVESGQSVEPFRHLEDCVRQSVSEPSLRQQVEAALIKLLAPSATFEARRFACKQLGIIGSKTALPTLADMLKSEETAGIACLALTTYPPGQADQVLRSALSAARGAVRIQIINTIGDRRDSIAVKNLAQIAGGGDLEAAQAAIASLGKIGDRAAWKAVRALRKNADPALGPALTDAIVRCAEALAASGAPEASSIYQELLAQSEPAYIRRSSFAALLRLDKDQGETRILKVLHSSDSVLKPVAIAAIRSLRSADASERFAMELPKLTPEEQVWLIASLEARGDAAARSAIGRSLALPDASARRAAIAALGQIGDSSSVALLVQALVNSGEAEDQRIIESSLIDLRGGTATDQAIAAELKKSSRPARVHLIAAIAGRQGPAANPLLFDETANSDPKVARAAFRALGRTAQPPDAPALLTKVIQQQNPGLRAEAESAATQVLARIEDAHRRSALVLQALRWANTPEARSALLSLLPACGDADSLAALKAAVAEPDPQIREAAIRALADWPDAMAWDSLIAVYRQPENESMRSLALRGLVRLAGEENAHADRKLVERYMQLLSGARSDGDLKLILGALSGAANPDALQLALPLLTNSGIRPEAELAVKKIAHSIKAKYPDAAQAALQKLEAK